MKSENTEIKEGAVTALKLGVAAIAVGAVLFGGLHAVGVLGTVATAPGRVINKTLSTDNIIANYEWFYDTNAQAVSRVGQLKAHATLLASETNLKEKSKLRVELAAMQQSCRDLVVKYNANSGKANKSVFKSGGLPPALAMSMCEVVG